MGREQKISQQLNRHPGIKRKLKRIYQRTCYTFFPKLDSEGLITKISPEDPDHEYFFGYYGICPEDRTGRYVLCLKAKETRKETAPAEEAEILLIDLLCDKKDPARIRMLARTRTWNVQQGCMMQWMGPDYGKSIIYNDFRDGKFCSVILDVFTGRERILPMPVYSVSPDGSFALTLDFSRLHRLRPGYGYSNAPEETKDQKLPDTPCIWRLDLISGAVIPILKYTDFASFEPRSEMTDAEHKVNHLMISPDGQRFMVLHRWFHGERKYSRLLTANTDGTGLYNLSDDDMVSHCYWKDPETILAFENKKGIGTGYFLMKDRTGEFHQLWSRISADGHPSYSPDGSMVVTDSYPDRRRVAAISILRDEDEKGFRTKQIARVFAPFSYDNETRCDLHPRWSRNGQAVYFDAVFEGRRGLYSVDAVQPIRSFTTPEGEYPLVSCVIPTYKRSEMLLRAIDSALRQTYQPIEVLVVDDNVPDDEFSLETQKRLEIYRDESRVHYLRQEKHINGAVARNFGMHRARGEYIAFLDDDDEWTPEKIEIQMKYLLTHPEKDGATTLYNVMKGEKIIRHCPPYTAEDLQLKVFMRAVSVFTSTFIAKKKVLESFGGFDETLLRHQDLQLLVDFLEHGAIEPIPEYLVVLHADSDINKPNVDKMIAAKKAFFNSVAGPFAKYDRKTRKRIRKAHCFEVAFAAVKAKKYGIALKYLAKAGFSARAWQDVLERYLDRI